MIRKPLGATTTSPVAATVSVGHRTAASRGETNGRTTPTRPCPGTIASITAASSCRLCLCHDSDHADEADGTIASYVSRRARRRALRRDDPFGGGARPSLCGTPAQWRHRVRVDRLRARAARAVPGDVGDLELLDQMCWRSVAADRDLREPVGQPVGVLTAELGAYERASEGDVCSLIRPVGWRRLRRFAGSIGGSGVASGGVTPDPVTAIRGRHRIGSRCGTGGDRSRTNLSFFEGTRRRTGPASALGRATWTLMGESN
jgi:hypothetical protein